MKWRKFANCLSGAKLFELIGGGERQTLAPLLLLVLPLTPLLLPLMMTLPDFYCYKTLGFIASLAQGNNTEEENSDGHNECWRKSVNNENK